MYKIIIGILFAFLCMPLANAETRPIISIAVGSDHADVGSSTNIIFIPPFYNTYAGSNIHDSELLGGLFIGAATNFSSNLEWQYGISYYQNSVFQAHGVVEQFGDPNFANLNYYYQIQSRRYIIETKLLYAVQKIYHPFINLGLGLSVNKSYNYIEQPVTSADVPMSDPFANKTYRNFTYFIGIGVDIDITQRIRLGGGYRFVNLGRAGLNTSSLQQDSTTIKNIIRSNEFFVQLSLMD